MTKLLQKTIVTFLLLLSVSIVNAQSFQIGYLSYTIISGTTNVSVQRTSCISNGIVIIPTTVKNNGITYTVTSIKVGGFAGCFRYTSVCLPNSLTSIGKDAFLDCLALQSVTIPNSVTSIGESAFKNCRALTKVNLGRQAPLTIIPEVFTNLTISDITLNVPLGSISSYETANVWKDFTIKEETPCKLVNRLYVDGDIAISGDGTSWNQAFKTVQEALDCTESVSDLNICGGKSIWVAEGTYFPTKDPFGNTSPTDPTDPDYSRDKTFYIPDGVKIYGGFVGTETTLVERSLAVIANNTSTLSGDIGIPNDNNDNSYHVVLAAASEDTAIGITIDGFTITGGNANGADSITVKGNQISRVNGGGIVMYNGVNSLYNNVLFENEADFGGGVFTNNGTNMLYRNTLSRNSANSAGGGIITFYGNNTLTNNTLSENSAKEGYGGGIYVFLSTSTLVNNILSENSAKVNGGGIYKNESTNTLNNNTLMRNDALNLGGGIFIDSGNNILFNNVLSDNSTTNYGGGIHIVNGTNTLINNTLSRNEADQDGGGIYMFDGTNTLINNIFWDNKKGTDETVAGADYNFTKGSNTFKNNLLQLPATFIQI